MGTADGADMNLWARGALGFWAFDTMEFNYMSNDDVSHIDVNMYGVKEWGAATCSPCLLWALKAQINILLFSVMMQLLY